MEKLKQDVQKHGLAQYRVEPCAVFAIRLLFAARANLIVLHIYTVHTDIHTDNKDILAEKS